MDPIADLFSWQSSYAYAANNPIRYIDFMGMSPVGADGLTNDQWLETSRPGADSELKKKYIAQNRNQEHQKRQMASVFSMSPEELSKRGFSGYYVTNSDGEILSHTVDGMGTFYSGGGEQAGGGGFDTFLDYTGITIGGASLANNGAKVIAKEYVRQVGINNRLAGIKNAKLPGTYNSLKGFGNKLGVVGGVVIAGDILYNSEIQASHGINAIMTGIAFTGWGAPVAGIWFVADFGTGLVTGRSISDRIDSSVGSPLVDWDW